MTGLGGFRSVCLGATRGETGHPNRSTCFQVPGIIIAIMEIRSAGPEIKKFRSALPIMDLRDAD
jgi:hypothetical protein